VRHRLEDCLADRAVGVHAGGAHRDPVRQVVIDDPKVPIEQHEHIPDDVERPLEVHTVVASRAA
jgi:hypothetical protein